MGQIKQRTILGGSKDFDECRSKVIDMSTFVEQVKSANAAFKGGALG